MKTKFLIFAMTIVFIACSKDDGPVPIQKSNEKQITSFAFLAADNTDLETDVYAAIDQNTANITASVPNGTDISTLEADVAVSPKATLSPAGAKNFTDSVKYMVTAEDGTTATYQTTVNLLPSGEKQLIGFRFLGIESEWASVDISGTIDTENKTVMVVMPSGTDITSLEPNVEISPGAAMDPEGSQDFTDPINYTVTAADGTSTTYLVQVTVSLTEKEILLLIAKENPGNGLNGWHPDNSLEEFNGVILNNDGKVMQLYIDNRRLTILPPEIGRLVNLRELSISNNALASLPPEIGQLGDLTILSSNNINLSLIPPEIGQLDNLTILSLEYNPLLTSLPPEIGQLGNLMRLNLRNNALASLPPEIGRLVNLEELSLSGNALVSLAPEIGQLFNLRELSLHRNALASLPPEIGQLVNLEELSLYKNELASLPQEIAQLGNLKRLFLHDNEFETLPPEIGQLVNLEVANFSQNPMVSLPSEIGLLEKLERLYLVNNHLLTSIPYEIGRLGNLIELNLIGCALASVPKALGNLTQLEFLLLADTGLMAIPEEVCDLDISRGGSTNIDIIGEVNCVKSGVFSK